MVEIVRGGRERIAHGFAWRRPGRRGAAHLGGEQPRGQDGGLRRCHVLSADAGIRHSPAETRHRELTTARLAVAFRTRQKDTRGATAKDCATCGDRCRGGKAWCAISVRRSWNGGSRRRG